MRVFTFISILLIALVVVTFAKKSKGKAEEVKPKKKLTGDQKWKNLKVEDLEKEWENGDSEEEIETEHDRLEKLRAARRPQFDIKDPESMKKAYKMDPSTFGNGQGGAGTAMIFVDVYKKKPKGGKENYSEKEVNILAKKWTSMLSSGGVLVQVYNPSENMMLVNIDRGWQTKEVMKFLANQREVQYITLNQKKQTPKEYKASIAATEDEDDDEDL